MGLYKSAVDVRLGERIAEIGVLYDEDHILGYEGLIPHTGGIHNSADAAARSGFSQIFASGTMMVAHTVENLLPDVFGEGWTHHGRLNLAFMRPIVAGSQVTLVASVVAKLPSGLDTLIVMEVAARLPNGEVLAAGSASALAAG